MADTTVNSAVRDVFNAIAIGESLVWTSPSVGYVFFVDSSDDMKYSKTTDGGANWGAAVNIRTGTVPSFAIWFDKWTTGGTGTKVHVAYTDSGTDDVYYRSLDTSGDTLGTEITLVDASNLNGPGSLLNTKTISITKARGGNVYARYIDNLTAIETGFFLSEDDGGTWETRANGSFIATGDRYMLFPGNESDQNDIWCVTFDASASDLILEVYDESGDTWSNATINASIALPNSRTNYAGAIRHSDNHLILVAWSVFNAATADLLCWDINGTGSITAKTDVATNLDDTAACGILINQQSGTIYIVVTGQNGETQDSAVNVWYYSSTDGGSTWSSATQYSEATAADLRYVTGGMSVGNDGGRFQPAWYNTSVDDIFVNLVNDIEIAAAGGGGGTIATRKTLLGVGR